MQTKRGDSKARKPGDAVGAAVDLGAAVAPHPAIASALATLHLERVLAHGGNTQLAAALAELARDPAPPRVRAVRFRGASVVWA